MTTATTIPATIPKRLRPARVRLRALWRRLISMRTALVLLFLLALAAVPGSLLPQRPLNPAKVQTYLQTHGAWGTVLDRIGGFDVFGSAWFAAVYLLLFISLIGCLVPRIAVYLRAVTARPIKAPSRLDRLAEHAEFRSGLPPQEAALAAGAQLRPRWRTAVRSNEGSVALSAEKGYLREAGNLLFHVSLLAALVLIALGRSFSFQGTNVITEGEGFCTAGPWDSFKAGRLVDAANLAPFCIDKLDSFTAAYRADGSPSEFKSVVTYSQGESGPSQQAAITVNHPLRLSGDRVYLLNHGYSPVVTVQRPGRPAVTTYAAFLPQDSFLTSEGAITFNDAGPGHDIAISGLFAPTPIDRGHGVISSGSPQAVNPVLAALVYVGDDGLRSGLPHSVYSLDQAQIDNGKLKQVAKKNLTVGQHLTLPDQTVLTFTGYRQWATLQVSHDPSQYALLAAAVCMVLGLMTSLFVRRRRLWLRFTPDPAGGHTLVGVGGLARTDTGSFDVEFQALCLRLASCLQLEAASPPAASPPPADVAADRVTAGRD